MADIVTYEEAVGSLADSRTQLEDSRDDAVDWMDEYYKTPETVGLVSDNMEELLDPTSQYMLDAQASSEKARSEQGYLDSGFNKGMGTVAAIDNAFDTSLNDAYVDIFNANEVNQANRTEYLSAYEKALSAFLAQNNQTYKEHKYDLVVKGMEEAQEDLLELKDKEEEYAHLLQDSQHEDNMDRIYYKQANDLANRTLRNTTGLQGYYLEAFTDIMSSDILQSDKFDQLTGLGYQIDKGTQQAIDQQSTKVGDNPYGIAFEDNYESYDVGDRTDEEFVFSADDAKFEYVQFREIFDKIYVDIREQCNHACRDQSSLWYTLNDLLYTQLNALDKNSPEFLDKMEYFNRTKYDALGDNPTNDEIEEYMFDIYSISSSEEFAKTLSLYTTPGRAATEFSDDGMIISPFIYDIVFFDRTTGELVTETRRAAGNANYYANFYSTWDKRDYDGVNFGNQTPPPGYEEARAACTWPMQWVNGRCVDGNY